MPAPIDPSLATAVASLTVAQMFVGRVLAHPDRTAVKLQGRHLTYAALNDRVNRLVHLLVARGVGCGDGIAILAENCIEYVELELAAAKLGAAVACQNWRQADPELVYCVRLTGPKVLVASERYAATVARIDHGVPQVLHFGEEYERALAKADSREPPLLAAPEDILIVYYTSGTTGQPKAAAISQRAILARATINGMDRPCLSDEGYIAWAPYFHMGSGDMIFATLLRGAELTLMSAFDAAEFVSIIEREKIGWLQVLPGIIDRFLAELKSRGRPPKGVRYMGVMVDLVPPRTIAELTGLVGAPYCNTFGCTETGPPPLSNGFVPVGVAPTRLSKLQASLCDIRLVDPDDNDVPDGEPGEILVRGPSLFSGYWGAREATAHDFRNGWFHMGDVFIRNPEGSYDFVDRRKYLIKSGGENIYPAEIERVLLMSPRIADAVVVRRRDARWGEVPVAFVVRRDDQIAEADVIELCRGKIANYKLPKHVRFVADADLPRSTTGKVKRHELEQILEQEAVAR